MQQQLNIQKMQTAHKGKPVLYINKNYVNMYQNKANILISPKMAFNQRGNSVNNNSPPAYGQKLNVQL
jgi:hypothetical protein